MKSWSSILHNSYNWNLKHSLEIALRPKPFFFLELLQIKKTDEFNSYSDSVILSWVAFFDFILSDYHSISQNFIRNIFCLIYCNWEI